MKTNRKTLAALFVGIAIIISTLLFGAFHFGMEYYVHTNATKEIQQMIRWYQDEDYDFDDDDDTRLYALLFYPSYYHDDSANVDDYYYKIETNIMHWVEKNAEPEKIYRVQLNNGQYYIEYTRRLEEPAIIYVDTTPEFRLINNISLVLGVLVFLAIIGSGSVGLVVGTRIEKDRNQQKEFFENASHELKTPLMVIEGYSDGLAKGMIPIDTGTSIIHEEVEKMTGLVNEILSISRLESGETKIQKEEVSLEELIENSLYPLQYQAQQKGIQVESHIEDQMIMADPVQMDKAISNLFNNALRYADKIIRIEAGQKGISISNDGQLPDPKSLEHLFDRFYTGKNGNTGIGLALTKEIVQKHGWKISVQIVSDMIKFTIHF